MSNDGNKLMRFGYIPKNRFDKSRLWNKAYRLTHILFGFPSYIRRLQAPVLFKFLEAKKKDKVLDLACGKGHFAYEIAKKGITTIAVDIKLSIDEIPNNKLPISFLQCDAKYLPIKNKSIDKILMSSFLQMVKEDKLILEECHGILKKNGLLVLSVPMDYLYIPKLYRSNWIYRKLKNLLNLPKEYRMFLSDLNSSFGVEGKGYYSLSELKDLIAKAGFIVEQYAYSPKRIGTFIYEFLLSIYYVLGKNKFLYASMFLFYPLGLIDNPLCKNSKGCEIVLKARKT